MALSMTDADGCCVNQAQGKQNSEPTVNNVMNSRIEHARKRVEELCIKKAKLETLNMLDMPWHQIQDLFE